MRALLAVIAAILISGCASTGPASTSGDPAAASASTSQPAGKSEKVAAMDPEDPGYWDEIICRREKVTGTRLTRARCHSRYDWERMRSAATETMRDIESQPRPCLDGAGCGGGT